MTTPQTYAEALALWKAIRLFVAERGLFKGYMGSTFQALDNALSKAALNEEFAPFGPNTTTQKDAS